MSKFQTSRELLQSLLDSGMYLTQISRKVNYHVSALWKVSTGKQDDLPYSIGKRIELLNIETMKKSKKRSKNEHKERRNT